MSLNPTFFLILYKYKYISYDTYFIYIYIYLIWASQVALVVKNPSANAGDVGDMGSVLGLGRSPGGGHNNPL